MSGELTRMEAKATTSNPTANAAPVKIETDRKNPKRETVPFYCLFAYADSADKILMVIGSIAAIGNGLCMPLMTIVFGEIIDAFGQNQTTKHVVHVVSLVSLKYVYLAMGVAIAASFQVVCWMVTGERQSDRIRNLYLKAILRQEAAFFDKEASMAQVVMMLSGDTVLIQDALGEKVGKFIQLTSTFLGGFIIAFAQGWLLTLVLLSCIPLLVVAGSAMAIIVSKTSTRGQSAYAKAAVVVEQAISTIRTVVSFTGEKHALEKYNKAVESAYCSSVHEGLATGIGLGSIICIVFGSYALAVWFGSKMILERGYTGGIVINVINAVLTGSIVGI